MLNVKKIDNILLGLFFASIPMMPIFTMYGFYTLGSIITFIYLVKLLSSRIKFRLSVFDIFYGLLIMWNIVSLKWSITGEKYVIKNMIIFYIFSISSIKLLLNNNSISDAMTIFFKFFVWGTVIITIICIAFEFKDLLLGNRLGKYIFAEPYGTRMMYTYNLEISIFLILYKIIEDKKNVKSMIFPITIVSLGIILSGTRKIFIGIITFYLIYIIMKNKGKINALSRKIILLLITSIASIFLLIKVPFLYNSFGYRIETAYNYINNSGTDSSMRDRNIMIDYGLKYWKESPIIGKGSNTFHYYFNIDYQQNLYAHNTFVELLCDLGIVGFALYYIIYISIIFSKKASCDYNILFKASTIALMILDYWTISYYRIHFMIWLELITTVYLYSEEKKKCIRK